MSRGLSAWGGGYSHRYGEPAPGSIVPLPPTPARTPTAFAKRQYHFVFGNPPVGVAVDLFKFEDSQHPVCRSAALPVTLFEPAIEHLVFSLAEIAVAVGIVHRELTWWLRTRCIAA